MLGFTFSTCGTDMKNRQHTRLSLLIVVAVFVSLSLGDLVSLGKAFDNPGVLSDGKGGFLLESYELPKGAVIAFSAYFMNNKTVRIQVWRPVDLAKKKYNKVLESVLVPTNSPGLQTVNLVCGDYIMTSQGDRIGIWNEENTAAIGSRIRRDQALANLYRFSTQNGGTVPAQIQFGDLSFPYEFSLVVHVDTDDWKYSGSCSSALTVAPLTFPSKPTTPPIINQLNVSLPFKYMGNTLSGVTGKLRGDNRRIYLIRDLSFTESGVVTAFYAYCVDVHPFRFQIWRNDSNAYILVGEHRFDPPDDEVPRLFEVPLDNNETAIHVQPGDVIAVTSESSDTSVAYTFVTENNEPSVYVETLEAGESYKPLGTRILFDPLTLPYYLAVGAVYDTETDRYPAPKPFPLTTPIPTGHPLGKIRMIGRVSETGSSFQSGAQRIHLFRGDLTLPSNGYARNFTFNAVSEGTVRFQIWRQVPGNDKSTYSLVGEVKTNVTQTGIQTITVLPPIEFRAGDVMGFLNEGGVGIINYNVNARSKINYVDVTSPFPAKNQQIKIDPLPLPYQFSVMMTYEIKEDPVTTENPTVPSEPKTGEIKSEMPTWLVDPRFILALFIWLVIITLLLLLLLVYLVCRRREYNDRSRYSSWASGLPPAQSAYHNMGSDLKDDENIDYFNPTIGSRPKNLPSKSNFANINRNGELKNYPVNGH